MSDSTPNSASNKSEEPIKNREGFDGTEGNDISLAEAAAQTKAFREKFPAFKIKGNFYGRQIIEKILHEPKCVGIRIYNSIDPETNEPGVILVGTDSHMNDILEFSEEKGKGCSPLGVFLALPASAALAKGTIAGNPRPCPTMCGSGNSINAGS